MGRRSSPHPSGRVTRHRDQFCYALPPRHGQEAAPSPGIGCSDRRRPDGCGLGTGGACTGRHVGHDRSGAGSDDWNWYILVCLDRAAGAIGSMLRVETFWWSPMARTREHPVGRDSAPASRGECVREHQSLRLPGGAAHLTPQRKHSGFPLCDRATAGKGRQRGSPCKSPRGYAG